MRSPGLMKAYYREPELTAETFTPDGWLRTGDKGHMDREGYLSITGRVKDMFKTSKGKYIAPAPIEDELVAHSSIEACAVTGANFAQPFAARRAVARRYRSEQNFRKDETPWRRRWRCICTT